MKHASDRLVEHHLSHMKHCSILGAWDRLLSNIILHLILFLLVEIEHSLSHLKHASDRLVEHHLSHMKHHAALLCHHGSLVDGKQ